jgi:hypothetical protein
LNLPPAIYKIKTTEGVMFRGRSMSFSNVWRLRHIRYVALCGLISIFAIFHYGDVFAEDPPAAQTQTKDEQQAATPEVNEVKPADQSQQNQSVTIPLKSIWGGHLQGARMFGQVDLNMPPGMNPTPLGVGINKALSIIPEKTAKLGFVVLGKSGEALQGAYAVLAENKKPLAPIPENSEVSLVFFSHGIDYSTRLHNVQVDGHKIAVRYQFAPESVKDTIPNLALISLGKLSKGEYQVEISQVPMDQKFIKLGKKAPAEEDVRRFVCQSFDFSVQPTDVAFKEVGQLEGIKDAEFRLGGRNRMIFVDDIWELDRCARLIPDLPWINVRKESLAILMNWTTRPRSIKTIHTNDATLVVEVEEKEVEPERNHPEGHGQFYVAHLPKWEGPIRFELQGKPQFTILRGEALDQRANQIWEEILRLHSGGYVNRIELAHYYQNLWPSATDQQIVEDVFKDKNKLITTPAKVVYPMLFGELVNIRARSVIPRVFELIQSTGKFDPILEEAGKSLIGIGGPELVQNCKQAIESSNPRSREAAMGVLATIGDPDTRALAYDLMFNGTDLRRIRGGLSILCGIGPQKADVPEIVKSMQRLESLLFSTTNYDRGPEFEGSSSDDICAFIYTLSNLGSQAEDALPVLEQMAEKPRFELSSSLKEAARKAVAKIKGKAPDSSTPTNSP